MLGRTLLASAFIVTCGQRPGEQDRSRVTTPEGRFVLSGGPVWAPPEIDSVRWDIVRLVVPVQVRNVGRARARVERGPCPSQLIAARAEDPDTVIWRQEHARPPTPRSASWIPACFTQATFRLAPGEAVHLRQAELPISMVLGDSLPDGRYRFWVIAVFNDRETPPIPAGEATLVMWRPSTPP